MSLPNLIEALLTSDLKNFSHEIIIINNFGELELDPQHYSQVLIWDDFLRPDFATGHLARDWNAGLVNGFQDLNNPSSDIVVLIQGDEVVKPTWASYVWNIMMVQGYTFLEFPDGDAFMAFRAEGVKKIGLFDYHDLAYHVFNRKWGGFQPFQKWLPEYDSSFFPQKPSIPTFMFYPYFEMNLLDLDIKNYVV